MRRANDNGFLFEGDVLVGVNLGADYCAEHEWGIKNLCRDFGIGPVRGRKVEPFSDPLKEGKVGIEARTITRVAAGVRLLRLSAGGATGQAKAKKSEPDWALVYSPHSSWRTPEQDEEALLGQLARSCSFYGDQRLATAWDEGSFAVRVHAADKPLLERLYQSFMDKDIGIWVGGGRIFQNGGLVLVIVSAIPFEKANTMLEADLDNIRLIEAAAETGIEARLKAAGKKWYALSPSWGSKFKTVIDPNKHVPGAKIEDIGRGLDTKHDVVFWLNPEEQSRNHSAWVTVEDLDQWIQGQGVIPKSQDQQRASR